MKMNSLSAINQQTQQNRTPNENKTQVEMQELKERFKNRFTDFIDYLLAKGFSSKTIERYVEDVDCFEMWTKTENVEIEYASYADVLHYIQFKKKSVQQITISSLTNSLKHYYNYLIASEVIKNNPVSAVKIKGIKRKKLYTILNKQELEGLYHAYTPKENEENKNQSWYKASLLSTKRNQVVIGLMVYQGLNLTDLQALTVKAVKLREGKIFIARTRRSNERELNLESTQILDLMEYILKTREELLAHTQLETDQLLFSTSGRLTLQGTLTNLFKQLRQINSNVNSLKQIRTSVIVHWLKIHNLREVQQMAGHRYVSSTEAYLVNDLEDLQEDITKFHPIS